MTMGIHFLRPYWFLTILPLIFLYWRLSRSHIIDNWHRVCDAHLLPHLLASPSQKIRLPLTLLFLGSFIAIFSLAGPSWHREAQPIYRPLQGTVLVLSLSPTMNDAVGTTTKIDRVRYKLLDYLNRQKEGQTGLVIFTDEAYTVSPLTEDNHTIATFIPALDPSLMPTHEDDPKRGLKEARSLLKQAGIQKGNIVLITDQISHFSEVKRLAKSFSTQGYKLYVYDISQSLGMSGDFEKVAAAGNGKVISLTPNNQDVDELLAKTKANAFIPPVKKTSEQGFFWHDDGRWLIFLLLPLALIAFRRGYL